MSYYPQEDPYLKPQQYGKEPYGEQNWVNQHSQPTPSHPNTQVVDPRFPISYPPLPTWEHPQAESVLLWGVLGIFIPLVSFYPWIKGHEIRAQEDQYMYMQSSKVTAGWMMGKIMSIIQLASVTFIMLMLFMLLLFGSTLSPI